MVLSPPTKTSCGSLSHPLSSMISFACSVLCHIWIMVLAFMSGPLILFLSHLCPPDRRIFLYYRAIFLGHSLTCQCWLPTLMWALLCLAVTSLIPVHAVPCHSPPFLWSLLPSISEALSFFPLISSFCPLSFFWCPLFFFLCTENPAPVSSSLAAQCFRC